MGIEPTYPAWKAGVLPLNYTRSYEIIKVHLSMRAIDGARTRGLDLGKVARYQLRHYRICYVCELSCVEHVLYNTCLLYTSDAAEYTIEEHLSTVILNFFKKV